MAIRVIRFALSIAITPEPPATDRPSKTESSPRPRCSSHWQQALPLIGYWPAGITAKGALRHSPGMSSISCPPCSNWPACGNRKTGTASPSPRHPDAASSPPSPRTSPGLPAVRRKPGRTSTMRISPGDREGAYRPGCLAWGVKFTACICLASSSFRLLASVPAAGSLFSS